MIKSFLTENGIQFPNGKKVYSEKSKHWLFNHTELEMTQKLLVGLLYEDLEHALKTKKITRIFQTISPSNIQLCDNSTVIELEMLFEPKRLIGFQTSLSRYAEAFGSKFLELDFL